jgi:hypothetical protein
MGPEFRPKNLHPARGKYCSLRRVWKFSYCLCFSIYNFLPFNFYLLVSFSVIPFSFEFFCKCHRLPPEFSRRQYVIPTKGKSRALPGVEAGEVVLHHGALRLLLLVPNTLHLYQGRTLVGSYNSPQLISGSR